MGFRRALSGQIAREEIDMLLKYHLDWLEIKLIEILVVDRSLLILEEMPVQKVPGKKADV